MDQVMEFGQKYSKWIVGSVLAGVVAVAAYAIAKSTDPEFVETDLEESADEETAGADE